MKPNHYATLGVPKGAPPSDIKRAYRRKAKATHPDKGGSKEAFQSLALAYRVLSDSDRRANYDATGDDGAGPSVEQQAVSNLAGLVIGLCDDLNPRRDSLKDAARLTVLENMAKLKASAKRLGEGAAKFRDAAKRFKPETHVARSSLESYAAQLEQAARETTAKLAVCEAMLRLVEEASYEVDQRAEPQFNSRPIMGGIFTVR